MKAFEHTYWEPVARAVWTEDYATCAAAGMGSQSVGIENIINTIRPKMEGGVFMRIEENNVFIGYAITDEKKQYVLSSKIRESKKDQALAFDNFVNSLVHVDYDQHPL